MAILFLIVFIDLLGFGLVIPLLPFYAEHFQAIPAVVAMVMATYSFTQFLTAPLWGRLSDRIGRRPVLLVTLAGAAVSYVWLGLAHSLWALFAARAVGGAMAGNISAAFAYAADITTPENRAKGMGLIGAAFGLGFIAGPAMGGYLAGPDPLNADFQTPSFVAAALSTIALLLAAVRLAESLSPEIRARLAAQPPQKRWDQFKAALQRPHIGLLIALTFLVTFVFSGMETTFAMWSERRFGWGPEQNGYLFAFVGLLSVSVQAGLIGRLARKFGEGRLVTLGAMAFALGLVLAPLAPSVPVLVVAMFTLGCGFSIITPSLNSLISLQAGAEEQGEILGVGRSSSILARVVGPVWAGFLFSALGKDWPFFAGAAVMVAVVILGLRSLTGARAARSPCSAHKPAGKPGD